MSRAVGDPGTVGNVAALTPARRRALEVLAANPEIGPAQFALLIWPDSPGHERRSHRHSTPAGGAVGAGIKMSAGAFLGRLVKAGLAHRRHPHPYATWMAEYRISEAGREALRGD